jgi:glycine oxidase
MAALAATLRARGVAWQAATAVAALRPHTLVTADGTAHHFDWVADCRGLGARGELPALRGVRGEVLRLHAPEVALRRPVRLMHPRYPLYVVPRPHGHYVVGATSLESDDLSPPSVRSLLELLSAAYTLHPAFAEARLVSATVNCRPAFPDHLPRLAWQRGLLRANGLYRHGFLLGPALVEAAAALLCGTPPPPAAAPIIEETAP